MITSTRLLSRVKGARVHAPDDESVTTRDAAIALRLAIAAEQSALHASQRDFVQLLADTMAIRDLYAKQVREASGPHARLFELICQRHHVEQVRLVELLAGLVRAIGADAPVMAGRISARSSIPRPPHGAETLDVQVHRLLNAHETIALQAIAVLTQPERGLRRGGLSHEAVLVASELVLTCKLHVWLLAEHLHHVSDASKTVSRGAPIGGGLALPFR
ncbi:MAG: hypothetical protein HEQ23_11975 [Tepidisphaera sp.]